MTVPLPGSNLGPYEIVREIGSGGMGLVYLARDTRLDRDVAIKVLPEKLADNPDAPAQFEREAKAITAVSPPNILSIVLLRASPTFDELRADPRFEDLLRQIESKP